MKKAASTIVLAFTLACVAFAEVEVIYFHGKQRCPTCRAIESETKSVLESKFADDVKSGRISFDVVDISNPSNAKIAEKYKVAWSSLYIVDGDLRFDMTKLAFATARRDPSTFKDSISKKISELLSK